MSPQQAPSEQASSEQVIAVVVWAPVKRRWFAANRQRLLDALAAQGQACGAATVDCFERILPAGGLGARMSAAVARAIRQEAERLLLLHRQGPQRVVCTVCHGDGGQSVLLLALPLGNDGVISASWLQALLRDGLQDCARDLWLGAESELESKSGLSDSPLLAAVPLQLAVTALALAASASGDYKHMRWHQVEPLHGGGDPSAFRMLAIAEVAIGPKQDVDAVVARAQLPMAAAPGLCPHAAALPVHLELVPEGGYSAFRPLPEPQSAGWRLAMRLRADGLVDLHAAPFGMESVRRADFESLAAYLRTRCLQPQTTAPQRIEPHSLAAGGQLIQRFEQVAATRGGATALAFEDSRTSYRDLDRQAGQLAQQIRTHGVGNAYVAVCMERSSAFVVALIAVLKAGCAYIPIDPATPAERRAAILADSGAAMLITDADDEAGEAGEAVFSVRPLEAKAGETASAGDAAYVIYTSGSTGVPKGVAVPDRNVLALVDACAPLFELGPDDVWSLFHSMAFDFSVWEMWGALLTGATLVVVSYWTSRDPAQFARLVIDEKVTVMSQTPSAFYQFIEQSRDLGTEAAQLALRVVVFGGEHLVKARLLPWFDRMPESRCRLVNMFGITETTVHVTWQTVTRTQALDDRSSVGVALPGWRLGICDKSGVPLPPGLTGEICVYGAGLARGYLNRADLTARSFDSDPHTGERRYRSGDLGRLERLDRDLQLFHYGRIDSQVKLRGFRIELGDIAAQIRQVAGVLDAAVLLDAGDGDPGNAALRAFVTGQGVQPSAIRARLAQALPDYMRPSSISLVPQLPVNHNGKLDAKTLLADYRASPEQAPGRATVVTGSATASAAAAPSAATAAPSTLATWPEAAAIEGAGLQERYCAVWSEYLGQTVGAQDNFFDLGGNSLVAIKLNQRLRALNLPEIPFKTIYLHQNIATILAARVHEHA